MDKYQQLIRDVKEYIEKKEAIKGTALTDEDFVCEEAPCKSKPELIFKDGSEFWVIDGVTIIDHSNDILISNDTTFAELLRILAANPDVAISAQMEAEEKAEEAKEEKLREIYGEDYDLIFDKKQQEDTEEQTVAEKPKRRPGAIQLRNGYPYIAVMEIGANALLEIFNNGYAVYDNGDRKVVLWVPDCGAVTYYFTGLRDKEKDYLSQHDEVGMDVMGQCPWYNAVLVAGENRIEYNMDHPKSKGNTSDFDMEDDDIKPATHWVGGAHFDTPEEAYLRKEAREEVLNALSEKLGEIYVMKYELGMTQMEIAKHFGVTQVAVHKMLRKIKEELKKFF